MADIRPLALPEVLLITPIKHGDDRGFFSETFSSKRLADAANDSLPFPAALI